MRPIRPGLRSVRRAPARITRPPATDSELPRRRVTTDPPRADTPTPGYRVRTPPALRAALTTRAREAKGAVASVVQATAPWELRAAGNLLPPGSPGCRFGLEKGHPRRGGAVRPARTGRARKRRSCAERWRLAASRQGEEREREREMHQQAAEASSLSSANVAAHPRHVSPSRNHATDQLPSLLSTQSLSQPTIPRSALGQPHECVTQTRPYVRPGDQPSATGTRTIIGTPGHFCQDPTPGGLLRRPPPSNLPTRDSPPESRTNTGNSDPRQLWQPSQRRTDHATNRCIQGEAANRRHA